jgi:hypothetical protein
MPPQTAALLQRPHSDWDTTRPIVHHMLLMGPETDFSHTSRSFHSNARREAVRAAAWWGRSSRKQDRTARQTPCRANPKVKAMIIFRTPFNHFSIATQIFGTLVAGSVLIAGIDAANAHGSGGGGGNHGGGGSMGSHNSGGNSMGGNSRSSNGNFWSGSKSNHAIIEKQGSGSTRTLPVITKGNGSSKGTLKESRRELRKEYKHELKKKIAELKKAERCKVFGKCGGSGKPVPVALGPTPVKIGKPIPSPVEKPPVTTTGGGTRPVLSDPGYGKPGTGSTGGSSGGGPASPGHIGDTPSPGTTTKPF